MISLGCTLRRARRSSIATLVAMGWLAGCVHPEPSDAERFLDEPDYRRHVLEDSLVNPDNGYSRLRLQHYATSKGSSSRWDDLPVYNPSVTPLRETPGDAPPAPSFDGERPRSDHGWITLGETLFHHYPAQFNTRLGEVARNAAEREAWGLWHTPDDRIGGLVEVTLDSGPVLTAMTCSTCHARPAEDGRLLAGLANQAFDFGAIEARHASAERAAELLSWGPGRLDVTPDASNNPVAIPDLRPIRHQRYLHAAATVKNSLPALAVRIETLLITSLGANVRPPREVAYALAMYLWSLAAPVDSPSSAPALGASPGAATFARQCAGCHHADGSTLGRVPLELVGTDPAVGLSSDRGTGYYRVPSLVGVASRGHLLHDLSASGLEDFLAPERSARNEGHPFGQDLSPIERLDLTAFLRQSRLTH